MSETTTNATPSTHSPAEQLMRLLGRAEMIGDLPMLSQPRAAREILTDAFAIFIEIAEQVEALTPYADETAGDDDGA